MSFLNPVNEAVLRFKSTDAGAPQINYNSRVAGDVKAVLKACLVTGYDSKASAGWSIANEVGHVAEFVSPSAAMSDYRLGIDDTSTSSTTWYYQYQNVKVMPTYNFVTKDIKNINKTSASNGWQILVTDRGVFLLESFLHGAGLGLSSRMTYWGGVKLAVSSNKNIAFFSEGHEGIGLPEKALTIDKQHYSIDSYTVSRYVASSPYAQNGVFASDFGANIDISSAIYLATNECVVVAEQAGLVSQVVGNYLDVYGVREITIAGRPAIAFCGGYSGTINTHYYGSVRNFAVYLDYWEY